jgi:hypothetical protein
MNENPECPLGNLRDRTGFLLRKNRSDAARPARRSGSNFRSRSERRNGVKEATVVRNTASRLKGNNKPGSFSMRRRQTNQKPNG